MKYLKKSIIFFSFFLFITNIFAQQIIRGTVKDSITHEPIIFVAIKFLNINDSLIYTAYSDDNGVYNLPYLANIESKLTAEILGYNKYERTFEKLNENTEYQHDIFIAPKKEFLTEIEITESANRITRKLDRTIVNITNEQIKTSQNIYDILKSLPGVFIDESTNTIRFKGSAPDILINNLNAEYIYSDLKAIDISLLESIELIDKSSIYGGAGEGGIINIKLKQEKQKNFGAYIGFYPNYDLIDNAFVPHGHLNLNFGIGKITIINNLNLYSNYWATQSEGVGNFISNNINFEKELDNKEQGRQTHIKNTLGVIIPLGKAQLLIADQIEYSPIRKNSEDYQKSYIDTLFYHKILQTNKNSGSFFTNMFRPQLTVSDFYNQDINLVFIMANFLPMAQIINTTNISEIFQNNIITIDTNFYKQTVNSKITLYNGYLQYKYNISQSSHFSLLGYYMNCLFSSDKTFIINEIEHPQYNTEDKNAKILNVNGVASYAKRIKNFSIDLTLGYNFQQTAGNFIRNINNTDTVINLNLKYHDFEPSARFKYNVNNLNSLYLGYSYSTDRFKFNNPSENIKIYIPYIEKTDPLNWQSGNPNLKLAKFHKIYFQYIYSTDSINFSTELFYSLTNNDVSNILIPINTETTLTQPENMAFSDRIGADLNFYYLVSERWALSIGSQLYYSRFKDNSKDIISEIYGISAEKIEQKSFGVSAQVVARYNLKSNIGTNPNIRFWLDYNSKQITFTGYDSQYVNANIAFRTNFFKNKFYMSLGLENFLSPFIHKKTIYDYLNLKTETSYYYYETNMRISLSLGLNLFAGERGTKDFKL